MATYIKGDAVANATSYELYEKVGTSYNLKATASEINFNLDNLNFEAGDHVLVVKAKADGYEDSDYSNEVTYTVAEPITGNLLTTSSDEILQDSSGNYLEFTPQLATPQNVTADGTTVSWDEVENATSYAVLADGSEIGTVEAAANLISFNIEGTSYQAEEGMTWEQWVNSSYNTGRYYVRQDGVITNNIYFVSTPAGHVSSTDTIISDYSYAGSGAGGGSGR